MKYQDLSLYDYYLPKSLIAQKPSSPRDSAKLLVYYRNENKIIDDRFYNLAKYLPVGSLLVMNNSKVIPARIMAHRQTGGKCEILMVKTTSPGVYQALFSRAIALNEELVLNGGLKIRVIKQTERDYFFKTDLSVTELIAYLEKFGQMPIPPYIKNPDSLAKLQNQYQTVFAKQYGSIAAPTASLHFTKRLLQKLTREKIKQEFVTLHVGMGTFAPLTERHFVSNQLHGEYYQVSKRAWQEIMDNHRAKKKIIAVGTTVVRTLEEITKTLDLSGETKIFIKPGYRFKLVNGLLTNFHLPKSSLLLLICAFINDRKRTLALYEYAVKHRYRFYSFGDAMLIL
ncbi:tRNA preQ1(34) S-adenosylmethionine ribosyltransferase-isomerase QueA [Candidatus Roizmanbacteria bacterium RIFOXYB2_FULL_41_10]|uniref:S-adenosylmethionine:tRNA ribosyltransferase-isomerase n=1 Tax=Candidatus Roizmanbacteria bacterium RIFOXYA1_FULL_41_12 TaxID=1802082 RepID=A0A1F7KAK3_9BACT|nr:MAG: tRNA preQ1(34) S-adenosylmethionine ribosyltransferase-isomerase QueA [Candidatus Roizmanbacteria bacterium RIFOXYA1_FULL_41_12]OGK66858.1 MAG: tRNA preQ1(34) S-adenosylmethionine ribosyltransferase-isomerase QueA [Candidatus Roizmanbacteria bacterium RIFOXYB1_FULL_41_27]OGK67263.1 MAG: tRNA preQ1(34) S-adenosylmethionine ribosyltransferase-isomerase QueA [Candidatus Roizmanbacteria bacterium RIFOXYA2_FULL_41_8]OGK70768.1 MAG: tRNA preQ1(34) S-adenosylmethionine ribosyltransferase-isomer